MHRIIFQLKTALQIMRDLLTQLLQTGIGRIKGPPLLQGIDPFIPDVPGRVKIRFTYAQGYGVLHLAYDVKKFTDPRRGDGCDGF